MKLILAFAVWGGMAAVLAKGLVMAVDGKMWLLSVGTLGFIALCAKFGCLTHE